MISPSQSISDTCSRNDFALPPLEFRLPNSCLVDLDIEDAALLDFLKRMLARCLPLLGEEKSRFLQAALVSGFSPSVLCVCTASVLANGMVSDRKAVTKIVPGKN